MQYAWICIDMHRYDSICKIIAETERYSRKHTDNTNPKIPKHGSETSRMREVFPTVALPGLFLRLHRQNLMTRLSIFTTWYNMCTFFVLTTVLTTFQDGSCDALTAKIPEAC